MPIYDWKVRFDARDIYLYGNKTFQNVTDAYVEPIKQYAGQNFTQEQIDNALAQGWITQQEYDDTMTYKNGTSA